MASRPSTVNHNPRAEIKGEKKAKKKLKRDFGCKDEITCKFLMRHLKRDSNTCVVDKSKVEETDQIFDGLTKSDTVIRGSIRYVKIYPGKYRYQVIENANGDLVVKASVFFNNHLEFTLKEMKSMERKFKKASEIWNKHNPYDFNLKFEFKIVYKKKGAGTSAKLKRTNTRGPYFKKWSQRWSAKTIAHEMGHIMGLDDEYSNNPLKNKGAKKCIQDSIMCRSNSGSATPKEFHYYVILRRLQCPQA